MNGAVPVFMLKSVPVTGSFMRPLPSSVAKVAGWPVGGSLLAIA